MGISRVFERWGESLRKRAERAQTAYMQSLDTKNSKMAELERHRAAICDSAVETLLPMLARASSEWEAEYLFNKMTRWEKAKAKHLAAAARFEAMRSPLFEA